MHSGSALKGEQIPIQGGRLVDEDCAAAAISRAMRLRESMWARQKAVDIASLSGNRE